MLRVDINGELAYDIVVNLHKRMVGMNKLQIYVADADAGHVDRLKDALNRHRDLKVVGSASDGGTAFRQLLAQSVDVLILDPQLPGMDGYTLLKDLKRMDRCPTCLVCTWFYSSLSAELACRCGASYVLYKPLDFQRLPEIVLDCMRDARKARAPARTDEALRARTIRGRLNALGFPSSLNGTAYLTSILLRAQGDPSLLRNLSKGLYADVSAEYGTTPARVERSLRNAIAVAHRRGALNQRFRQRPCNREFLAYMIREMEESTIPSP